MFYKVIKNKRVIDLLDRLVYVKYKNKSMMFCTEDEAQAILSSDGERIWHVDTLDDVPVNGYDTVHLEEIDAYEYEQLKVFNMKTPEDVVDEYTALLLKEGVI